MPNGVHNHHGAFATPRVRNGEPQPAPVTPVETPSKRDLTSWWKQFSKRNAKKEEEKGTVYSALLARPTPEPPC